MTEPVLAWHFLKEDRRLRFGDRTLVRPGLSLSVGPPLKLCVRGLHASERPTDALFYAPGPVVCRVELSGEIVRDDDKLCAEHRKVLWMADAMPALRRIWCDLAERYAAQHCGYDMLEDVHDWQRLLTADGGAAVPVQLYYTCPAFVRPSVLPENMISGLRNLLREFTWVSGSMYPTMGYDLEKVLTRRLEELPRELPTD